MNNENLKLISIGIIAGFVNGLFGSGGGAILVPCLVFIMGIDDYKAHATSLSIILPLSIISTIIYLFNSSTNFKYILPIIIGGGIGSFVGAKVLNKIPINFLRKIFGSVIIYTAIRMLWK